MGYKTCIGISRVQRLRLIKKSLHDPRYLIPWELPYLSIRKSRSVFDINTMYVCLCIWPF